MALGISGKLQGNWIADFLRNRKQIVVVQGFKSEAIWVVSGVPQGSVLGPFLLLLIMYDITEGITYSILSSFADDTKMWKGINNSTSKQMLQNDLNHIYDWALQNNMAFNNKKFQAIRFQSLFSSLDLGNYTDSAGIDIEFHKHVKDLGIFILEDLSFDEHIKHITAKGKQMAGWILRVFDSRSPFLMKILLKQLIIPRIEYGCVLWSPTSLDQIKHLESVQKFFTGKIHFNNNNNKDY